MYRVEYENTMFGYDYPPRVKEVDAVSPQAAQQVVFKLDPFCNVISVEEI